MVTSLSRADRLALTSLVCTVAILTLALHDLAVDDAFVTYRYAFNLAHQQGYVYNSGQATLSTTAPAYGLVLALFSWLGVDIPVVSNLLGALCIGAGGCLLYAIARRRGRVYIGWVAGMLYVLNPLLWLSLGMETNLQLALVLAAFAADEYGRPGWAGLALGVAFVTRYDAALAAMIIFFRRLWHSRRSALKMALAGLAAAAPVLILLTLTFGSPLPVTLLAKRAQNVLGVTGFYARTNFVQGLFILLRGWFEQTWLYALTGLIVIAGLVLAWRRERWLLPYVFWGVAQFVAYIFLDSAPYYWYYAPLVPAGVLLIALAVDWRSGIGDWRLGNQRPAKSGLQSKTLAPRAPLGPGGRNELPLVQSRGTSAGLMAPFGGVENRKSKISINLHTLISNPQSLISNLLVVLIFAPFIFSLALIWQAQSGPLPDFTTDASKVLPEAKVEIYRRVGEWLAANTPPTATLGATEIGVIGYYARRNMVDFLGLLQPDVANALAAGDPRWALFAYQPEYIALDAVNPIYSFDPRGDDWFRAAYRPIQRFDDERFWASPIAVYRRQAPLVPFISPAVPDTAISVNANFGSDVRLIAVQPSTNALRPGEPLAVRLWWRRLPVARDYDVSIQLIGQNDLIIAQRETHLTAIAHSAVISAEGMVVSQTALIGVPEGACAPDTAQLNIVLYDPRTGERLPVTDANGQDLGDSLRLARLPIERRGGMGNQVDISFGGALTLVSFDVSPRVVEPGESMRLVQAWRQEEEWREGLSVFVHLLTEGGKIITQADGPAILAGEDVRELKVPGDTEAGVYHLLVGVYRREGMKRLLRIDAVGQQLGDSLALCPVRVR